MRNFELVEPRMWAVVCSGVTHAVIGPCSEAEALDTTDVLLAKREVLPGEVWSLVEVPT